MPYGLGQWRGPTDMLLWAHSQKYPVLLEIVMELNYVNTACGDLVVELKGEMDALGSVKIRPELEKIAEEGGPANVFLDMREVNFLDSSGIGAIVFLYKRLKVQGRNLEITGVNGQPRELMELLRLHKAIPVSWGGGVSPEATKG